MLPSWILRGGRSFGTWLQARFAPVKLASLRGFVPSTAAGHDVVLLDWTARGYELEGQKTPLGPLSTWRTPTVFLGRTGMDMAIRWQLEGWFG